MTDWVYDIECYPNFFCCGAIPLHSDQGAVQFEISERVNHAPQLWNFLRSTRGRMIGFFSRVYDWSMLDAFMNGARTYPDLWQKSCSLFAIKNPFEKIIWRPAISQIDLAAINHFDNPAKATSLKELEFVMRSRSIEDLPFPPGTWLTPDQMNAVLYYNGTDILETRKFAHKNREAIEFREKIGEHALNYNDTKLGAQEFIEKLQAAGIPCYEGSGATRRPRQTPRPHGIPLADVVFPWIEFKRPELRHALEVVKAEHVTNTKGSFKHAVNLDGFSFDIGLGGIHGSIHRERVQGDNILDIDVTGYYPDLAIKHRFYPEHLGEGFCDIFAGRKLLRKNYAKGTALNTSIKLSMNAVFGNSNSEHSPFFDPKYFLTTTINGQLLQCMVAESILDLPGARIIQMNTDGLTIQFPDSARHEIERILTWWENVTGMDLECVLYKRMFIRDVNNYIAERADGKIKRKGAYEYKRQFWQNHSALIVPKAVEAYLIDGIDYEDFMHKHDDPFDFLLLAKAPGGSTLKTGSGEPLPKHTRYYISVEGEKLIKDMRPLPGKTERREIGIHAEGQAQILGERKNYQCSMCGQRFERKSDANTHNAQMHSWKITPCNVFDGDLTGIDYRYYKNEIEKLLIE